MPPWRVHACWGLGPRGTGQSARASALRRGRAKENARQRGTCRTQSRESSLRSGSRTDKAKEAKGRFTALLHHVTIELLRQAYHWLKREAAPGVDGMTWDAYGEGLEARLATSRAVSTGAYRAQPSHGPHPETGRTAASARIAALEDKVVQRAVAEVLNAIYEEDFLGFSYGFRRDGDSTMRWTRSRSASGAGGELDTGRRHAGFFDKISHEWLIRFVEHRVGDQRVCA